MEWVKENPEEELTALSLTASLDTLLCVTGMVQERATNLRRCAANLDNEAEGAAEMLEAARVMFWVRLN